MGLPAQPSLKALLAPSIYYHTKAHHIGGGGHFINAHVTISNTEIGGDGVGGHVKDTNKLKGSACPAVCRKFRISNKLGMCPARAHPCTFEGQLISSSLPL